MDAFSFSTLYVHLQPVVEEVLNLSTYVKVQITTGILTLVKVGTSTMTTLL